MPQPPHKPNQQRGLTGAQRLERLRQLREGEVEPVGISDLQNQVRKQQIHSNKIPEAQIERTDIKGRIVEPGRRTPRGGDW